MEKLDLTKKHKAYFSAKKKAEIIYIEKAQFISLKGKGDPSDKDFSERIQALYGVAYGIKFYYKSINKDFVVSKLEGLWWYDQQAFPGVTMEQAPQKVQRKDWEYRLLIRIPEYVSASDIDNAIKNILEKKQLQLADEIEFYEMTEGKCVQMMHLGPFEKELDSLQQMSAFMKENNLQQNGYHHEIYLSDFRKTSPENLKTILREPVK